MVRHLVKSLWWPVLLFGVLSLVNLGLECLLILWAVNWYIKSKACLSRICYVFCSTTIVRCTKTDLVLFHVCYIQIFMTTTACMIIGSIGSALCFQNDTFTIYQQMAMWRFILGVGCGGEYPLGMSKTPYARLYMINIIFIVQSRLLN